MKKILMIAAIMIGTFSVAFAQKPAEIKFEKLSHNFGRQSPFRNALSRLQTLENSHW